jgi:hypothetical protein
MVSKVRLHALAVRCAAYLIAYEGVARTRDLAEVAVALDFADKGAITKADGRTKGSYGANAVRGCMRELLDQGLVTKTDQGVYTVPDLTALAAWVAREVAREQFVDLSRDDQEGEDAG